MPLTTAVWTSLPPKQPSHPPWKRGTERWRGPELRDRQQMIPAASGTPGRDHLAFLPASSAAVQCNSPPPSPEHAHLLRRGRQCRPARAPCRQNARTDSLSARRPRQSPAEGGAGPGMAGLGTPADSHTLGCSQEAHAREKLFLTARMPAVCPPTEGNCPRKA